MKRFVAAIAIPLILPACASIDATPPLKPGVAAGLIGALGEGIIGADLGRKLGATDRLLALESEYRALEYNAPGASVAWTGKKAGQSGNATAGPPYQVGSQNCRQLVHVVTIVSMQQTRRGAACRNADGSWSPLD